MGVLRIPWGLAGTLLATTYLYALRAAASPSINVALKTSFNSAPYLLELLYDHLLLNVLVAKLLLEKPLSTRTRLHIILSSTGLRKAILQLQIQKRICMRDS